MGSLATQFMGLSLKSPIIVGSSGFTGSVQQVERLAQTGAGAVILKSLFEEQIAYKAAREANRGGVVYGEVDLDEFASYYERKHSVDSYIKLIKDAKQATDMPVIASINARSNDEWIQFCKELSEAGADGLQLNMFVSPFGMERTGTEIEEMYFDVVRRVSAITERPVAVKIGSSFTNLTTFTQGLAEAGAAAIVLFNRYYTPDFDIDAFEVKMARHLSSPEEYVHALRWLAVLSPASSVPLVGATGVHTGDAAVKLLLAGAQAVEVVSAVYKNGVEHVTTMLNAMNLWMDKHQIASLDEVRGRMSRENYANPAALERVQYMKHYGDVG